MSKKLGYELPRRRDKFTTGYRFVAQIEALHLLSIDPDALTVKISPALRWGHYADLHGRKVVLPIKPGDRPDIAALRTHLEDCDRHGQQE